MKLLGVGIEVNEEVIPITRIAIPKTQEPFHGPEPVKCLFINQLPDFLIQFEIGGLQFGHHQQIGAFLAVIQSVNGQHISP